MNAHDELEEFDAGVRLGQQLYHEGLAVPTRCKHCDRYCGGACPMSRTEEGTIMDDADRVLNALDCLEVIAREAVNFLKDPSATNRDFLQVALEKYESGDAYDFVSDRLYEGSERVI